MEMACNQNPTSVMWFFRDRGFDDKSINDMFTKCKRLEGAHRDRASENWDFLKSIGIQERKLPSIISKLVSYSIDTKLKEFVDFLVGLGLTRDGMIGRVLVKHPFIMGYNIDKRLRPTCEFLRSVGLSAADLQTVLLKFPEVVCRDVEKTLKPNFAYLRRCGFGDGQLVALVTGYPPILIKSIQNSLEPRMKFLVDVMGRQLDEVVDYPNFFQCGLKRTLESRHKFLRQRNIECSLSDMLSCNHKKFFMKYGSS
ncbi:Transcription termination factor MTERF6, chloroplastic/mitochondrial [Linum perenne]